MIGLLSEGFESAWLPCSLILLLAGLAVTLAAQEELLVAVIAFSSSTTFVAWLRFSDRGGDWPMIVAAVALVLATVLFLVPTVDGRDAVVAVGGALTGGAAAQLWEPCVGRAFGQLLNELPGRGPLGALALLAYMIGVLAPVIGFAALLKLTPDWIIEPTRSALAVLGGTVLAVMAVVTAVGLHDEVVGRLIQWSLT